MPAFERIPPKVKRDALRDELEVVTSNHGEEYVFYTEPTTKMLTLENRLTRMDIQENSQGEIRHAVVYYDGPEDLFQTPVGDIDALLRSEGKQMGSVDNFRVIMWHGISHGPSGDIESYGPWLDLLTGYNPMGIFPTVRETRALSCTYQGEDRTAIMSTVRQPTVPRVPRPTLGSGDEHAHYAEFTVSITDM